MEGFVKIPNWVFDLEPLEFVVYSHLVKIQSYREFKGEVKDRWFAKSKNELVKECGFGCHKRLTRVLEGMVKKNLLELKTTNTVTYFKLGMGKTPIGQNTSMGEIPTHMGETPIPTMGKMPMPTMGKTPNLHYTSTQDKLQDIDTQDIVTRNTSNVYNQSIHEIKKKKIEDTVTRNTSNHPIIPIFKNKEIPKMKELLLEYKDNEGELREPTHDELLCVAYIEDLGFSKDDFKDNNYTNVNQIILAVSSKVGKTLIKHGFKVSIDNKDYLDMLKNYLDANYNYFKINTSCF